MACAHTPVLGRAWQLGRECAAVQQLAHARAPVAGRGILPTRERALARKLVSVVMLGHQCLLGL